MVAKNVTKVRADQSEKHANPHFQHGQVYHSMVLMLMGNSARLGCCGDDAGDGCQFRNRLMLEKLDGRELQACPRGPREDQRSQN